MLGDCVGLSPYSFAHKRAVVWHSSGKCSVGRLVSMLSGTKIMKDWIQRDAFPVPDIMEAVAILVNV